MEQWEQGEHGTFPRQTEMDTREERRTGLDRWREDSPGT